MQLKVIVGRVSGAELLDTLEALNDGGFRAVGQPGMFEVWTVYRNADDAAVALAHLAHLREPSF